MTKANVAKIDMTKVKSIKDIKFILEAMSIEYDRIPENMAHFLVVVPAAPAVKDAPEVVKINFSNVKTLNDVKLIIGSLGLEFAADRVPAYLEHLAVPA